MSDLVRPRAGPNDHGPSNIEAVPLGKHIQSMFYIFSNNFYDIVYNLAS